MLEKSQKTKIEREIQDIIFSEFFHKHFEENNYEYVEDKKGFFQSLISWVGQENRKKENTLGDLVLINDSGEVKVQYKIETNIFIIPFFYRSSVRGTQIFRKSVNFFNFKDQKTISRKFDRNHYFPDDIGKHEFIITLNNNGQLNQSESYKRKVGSKKNFYISNECQEFLKVLCSKKVRERYQELYKSKKEKIISKNKKDVENSILSFNSKYDTDQNGILDIVENNDFDKLLEKYQSDIIKIGSSYIKKFVKLSNFMNDKSENLQNSYKLIFDEKSPTKLKKLYQDIEVLIESYNITIFHSFNLIVSLKEQDLITFYKIYETFDKMNVFDSNHERELKEKLTFVGDKIGELIEQTKQMEISIINKFDELDYDIKSIDNHLRKVNNKLWWNNFYQGIQVYQNRKTNKQLKIFNKTTKEIGKDIESISEPFKRLR